LIEAVEVRHRKSVEVRVVVDRKDGRSVSISDCNAVHRAVTPRLELAYTGLDVYIEVSSPGLERQIKDGIEFEHYIGRQVRVYRRDKSDWERGVLVSSDETGVTLNGKGGLLTIEYETIAKAKLDLMEVED
jgi:ribosome maturation factor RimP